MSKSNPLSIITGILGAIGAINPFEGLIKDLERGIEHSVESALGKISKDVAAAITPLAKDFGISQDAVNLFVEHTVLSVEALIPQILSKIPIP